MSQENADASEDIGHMPSLSSKSRETGELQDMYRRTLAASWAAQPGVSNTSVIRSTPNALTNSLQELKADECIEDIFAGGDGWGSHIHKLDQTVPTQNRLAVNDNSGGPSDEDAGSRSTSHTNLSSLFAKKHNWSPKGKPNRSTMAGSTTPDEYSSKRESGPRDRISTVHGRASLDEQVRKTERATKGGRTGPSREIDEFDNPYREDLRSWKIGTSALA